MELHRDVTAKPSSAGSTRTCPTRRSCPDLPGCWWPHSRGDDLRGDEQEQSPDPDSGREERDDHREQECDSNEATCDGKSATISGRFAVGEFRVMREVVGEEKIQDGDD
jgi:hypothetical protein